MSPSSQRKIPDDSVDILLVEDNPGDVRLTREAFKAMDRETSLQAVTKGGEAVEFLAQQSRDGDAPDLVLLDLNLPGSDGCEVLQAIRDDPELESLPVLMLSSSAAEEDVERCYDAQVNAYLTKPDDHSEFSTLAQTIERFWFDQARLPPIPA